MVARYANIARQAESYRIRWQQALDRARLAEAEVMRQRQIAADAEAEVTQYAQEYERVTGTAIRPGAQGGVRMTGPSEKIRQPFRPEYAANQMFAARSYMRGYESEDA